MMFGGNKKLFVSGNIATLLDVINTSKPVLVEVGK